MAKDHQVYLQALEEEYERPMLVRNLMPRSPSAQLSVTIGLAAGQGNPVNTGPINFTVTFSKPVVGFVNADVSFVGSTVGGTLAAAVTGGPSTYNVAVTGMTGNGLVAASVIPAAATDAVTGVSTPGSIAVFVTFDTTQPTVSLSKAAGQTDPTSLTPILFTAVFSDPVKGFTSAGISFSGTTAAGTLSATVTGSGTTYSISVIGVTGAGAVSVTVSAAAATDNAGNANVVSSPAVVTFASGGFSAIDGSLGAQAGTAQHPTLLSAYSNRPPWAVAGVDYITGSDASATVNPATLVQTGVSVNTSPTAKSVTINDDNVLLQNINFANGGYQLSIGGANAIVRNCNFSGGQGQWLIFVGNGGATIERCTLDGAAGGNPSGLIAFNASGRLTLQYNWFKNFEAHILENIHANDKTFQLTYHWNMIEQGGIDAGAHLNVLQFGGGTCNDTVFEFNTGLQGSQVASGGEWDQYYPNTAGGVITNVKRNYCTTITQLGANLAIGYVTHGGQTLNTGSQAHDNYYDLINGSGQFYTGSMTGWALSNNLDLIVGSGGGGGPSLGGQGTYLTYGARTSSVLNAPSGIANGDLLIAFLAVGAASNPANATPPAGWSALPGSPTQAQDIGATFFVKYHVFYKIASGEGGDYTFTTTGSTSTCGVVMRYTGVNTTTPFSPAPTANTGPGTDATALGLTTTVANAVVIFTEQDWGDNTNNTLPPTGTTPTFTERVDQPLIYIADGVMATPGATGNKTHTTNSAAGSAWGAYLIALNPA